MNPLILKYSERPLQENVSAPPIEYCQAQNLSVLKGTSEVALLNANLETDTFTKTQGESSDVDKNLRSNINQFLDTETRTFTQTESSDSDRDKVGIMNSTDTRTVTDSPPVAVSDLDR